MDPQFKEFIVWVIIPVVVISLFWFTAFAYVFRTRKKNPERFKRWYGNIQILEDLEDTQNTTIVVDGKPVEFSSKLK